MPVDCTALRQSQLVISLKGLCRMLVENILKNKGSDVVSVSPDMTAVDVARTFSDNKIGFAIVRDHDGDIIGTVTERDIVNDMARNGEKTVTSSVRDFMTSNIVTCKPSNTLQKVMSIMTIKRTRHVLVMDGEEVAGIVSIGDAIKCRLEETLLDEESLREYISGMGYT